MTSSDKTKKQPNPESTKVALGLSSSGKKTVKLTINHGIMTLFEPYTFCSRMKPSMMTSRTKLCRSLAFSTLRMRLQHQKTLLTPRTASYKSLGSARFL